MYRLLTILLLCASVSKGQMIINASRFYRPLSIPIVSSGLSIYYNAANSASYPGTGTTVYDISGNSNTGTFPNLVYYSSSYGGIFTVIASLGQGYFKSTSQPITNNSSFSLCAWVYIPTLQNNYAAIIDGGNIGVGSVGYALGVDNTNHIFIAAGAGYYTVNTISANTWYFIEATSTYGSPYTFHIYINGVEKTVTSSGSSSSMTSVSSAVWCGRAAINNSYDFNGYLPQVLVYNRAITSAEAIQNYNATKGLYGY